MVPAAPLTAAVGTMLITVARTITVATLASRISGSLNCLSALLVRLLRGLVALRAALDCAHYCLFSKLLHGNREIEREQREEKNEEKLKCIPRLERRLTLLMHDLMQVR